MMSPHHLHATTAAWSLQAARRRLTELVDLERRANVRQLLDAAPISSPLYGVRHGTGDHADPVAGSTLTARPVRVTYWTDLLHRLDQRVTWLAEQIGCAPAATTDPTARIAAGLPYLRLLPGTAAIVAKHLADEDGWVREALALPPARHPLIGIGCPSCGQRGLYVQSAGPERDWTVICGAGCVCTGQGCPCRMPGAVKGVAHIWPRAVVLGAVAGAAPTAA